MSNGGTTGGHQDFRRVVVAAAVGNVIEWYDFYIFGSLGALLAAKFFAGTNPAIEFLKTMVIFSDMEEELPKGVRRDLEADEFKGMRVLAMNVKKLNADNANPTVYRARMTHWQKQVTSHGAKEFAMVLEPEKLDELLDVR